MQNDTVLIDLASCSLTLGEVMARIESYKADRRYANHEIFMDGDRFAIVARLKPSEVPGAEA